MAYNHTHSPTSTAFDDSKNPIIQDFTNAAPITTTNKLLKH